MNLGGGGTAQGSLGQENGRDTSWPLEDGLGGSPRGEGGKRERERELAVEELIRAGWARSLLSAMLSGLFDLSISVWLTCLWQEDNDLEGPAH